MHFGASRSNKPDENRALKKSIVLVIDIRSEFTTRKGQIKGPASTSRNQTLMPCLLCGERLSMTCIVCNQYETILCCTSYTHLLSQ